MLLMNIYMYNNLNQFIYKKQQLNNYTKTFLYLAIKNYYLTIRYYKFLYLWAPQDIINFFYSNLYFLNILQTRGITKWFIFKLTTLNEFIKYFN